MKELRKGLQIDLYNGKLITYNVYCLDRYLHILFTNISDSEKENIEDILDNAYNLWNEDDNGFCCEEFLLESIQDFKDKIVAVIYDDENEEEED